MIKKKNNPDLKKIKINKVGLSWVNYFYSCYH